MVNCQGAVRAGGSARHRRLGTKRVNKEDSSSDLTNTELGAEIGRSRSR